MRVCRSWFDDRDSGRPRNCNMGGSPTPPWWWLWWSWSWWSWLWLWSSWPWSGLSWSWEENSWCTYSSSRNTIAISQQIQITFVQIQLTYVSKYDKIFYYNCHISANTDSDIKRNTWDSSRRRGWYSPSQRQMIHELHLWRSGALGSQAWKQVFSQFERNTNTEEIQKQHKCK